MLTNVTSILRQYKETCHAGRITSILQSDKSGLKGKDFWFSFRNSQIDYKCTYNVQSIYTSSKVRISRYLIIQLFNDNYNLIKNLSFKILSSYVI